MAKYRIMALPPNYKKGGGRKKKEVAQPGQWAEVNPEIVQPGEEGFDLPTSNAAPQSEFAIEQMSPEEQAAYLKKARYDEAMASYKPLQAEYKGLTRPSAQLILGEDYDADPSKFTNAGYFPIKTESGNYELMANKDIANLIYQKGVKPEVLSSTFGLGDVANIQKTFEPVYTHAASIHAQRNKEKIDQLVAKGFTKDQAINELVRQGEGNVEGLTKRYGEYTDAAFKKAQSDASKITTNGEQPSNFSKELYEGVQKSYDEAYNPIVKKAEENVASWDPYAIQPAESTAVRNIMIYDPNKGEYKTKGTTAHEDNLNNIAVYKNINEEREKGQREYVDAIKKLALDKNLTDDQKKSLLANPQALEQLVGDYNKWRTDNQNYTKGITREYTDLSLPYDQAVQDIENKKTASVNNGWADFYFPNPYMKPATPKTDITFSETGEGRYSPAFKARSIDGGVDMLDKEWLMGVIGLTGLPHAYQAANVISKFAPLASLPSLNVGNALIAKGVYDSGTKYIPDAAKAYNQAQEEGWTNKNTFDFGYNLLKTASSALPLTGALQEVKAVKNAKDAFSAGDATVGLLQTPDDPLKNYKAIKALGTIAGLPKQKGGSIQMELSDKEIKDYIKKGFIVEEIDIPEKQSGGTPSQVWYQYTGTPWSQAKAKGLTDGSMEQNLALMKRLQAGEFGEPKLSNEQYQNVRSGYDQMVEQMVGQGKTLDQLVQQRVGTREGLKARFPELFKTESTSNTKTPPVKSQAQKDAELKAARDWLTGKVKEIGSDIFDAIGDSYWGKLAKKAGSATVKYLEAEAAKNKAAKAKQAQKVKAVEKKVEKKVENTVKKVANPIPDKSKKLPIISEQRPKKTPTVLDILNQKSIFDFDPLENLKKYAKPVEEKKETPMTTYDIKGIVDQIQKGQKMGPPPSLTRQQSQQPLGDNSMAAQFMKGYSPQKVKEQQLRNKALGIKDIYMPVEESLGDKIINKGSEILYDIGEGLQWVHPAKWLESDLGQKYIADPAIEGVFGEGVKNIPRSKEEFIETPTGQKVGKKILEWNESKDNWIDPFGPAVLSKEEQQWLKRKLEKDGTVDTPDGISKPKESKKKIVETPKPDKFYEEITTVQDSYDADNTLLSYRNQWDNSEGFTYQATPVKKDRSEKDEYKDVLGVGHFVLDASPVDGKTYMHPNNINYLRRAIRNDDYIPVYESLKNGKLTLKYKKYNELSAEQKENLNTLFKNFDKLGSYNADWPSTAHQSLAQQYAQQQDSLGVKILSPLRQMKLSDIDFSKTQTPAGFKKGINEVMTKDGKGTYLLFKNRDGYSRFSGGSVVFIFKDKYGNTIVRDFAGSLNQIENEGINIQKQYNIKPEDITIGYHDVGSFSAKLKANAEGKLKSKQWEGFNNEGWTGGALLIPKSK